MIEFKEEKIEKSVFTNVAKSGLQCNACHITHFDKSGVAAECFNEMPYF
jgi:hypothetical protein